MTDEQIHEQIHELIHRRFSDGRLTPGCSCGWYSIDGSHWRFERHLTEQAQR